MRALVIVALVAATVHAEPLPPGAIQFTGGMMSGAGADSHRVGYGYMVGATASWQPITTQQRLGWALRWSTLFGASLGNADAARIDTLRTVLIDLTIGIRVRPWSEPGRYLTLRGGAELFRSNQEIEPSNDRVFAGPVMSVGFDQSSKWWLCSLNSTGCLFSLDVRYGLISNGPEQVSLVLSVGLAGP